MVETLLKNSTLQQFVTICNFLSSKNNNLYFFSVKPFFDRKYFFSKIYFILLHSLSLEVLTRIA